MMGFAKEPDLSSQQVHNRGSGAGGGAPATQQRWSQRRPPSAAGPAGTGLFGSDPPTMSPEEMANFAGIVSQSDAADQDRAPPSKPAPREVSDAPHREASAGAAAFAETARASRVLSAERAAQAAVAKEWLQDEAAAVSQLIALTPGDALQAARGRVSPGLLQWATSWATLFPQGSDALLPGIGAAVHAAVLKAAPPESREVAWATVRAALQNQGVGCGAEVASCGSSAAPACLVDLSTHATPTCKETLGASLFGACLGQLTDCGAHLDFPAVMKCLKDSGPGPCQDARTHALSLLRGLSVVLAEEFSPGGWTGVVTWALHKALVAAAALAFVIAGGTVLAWGIVQFETKGQAVRAFFKRDGPLKLESAPHKTPERSRDTRI